MTGPGFRSWARGPSMLALALLQPGCFLPSFEKAGEAGGSGGGGGAGGQAMCESATFTEPPASSAMADPVTFFVAVRKIDLGEEELATRPGFDLDGVCTCCADCSQAGACTPPAGSEVCDASGAALNAGRDNAMAAFLKELSAVPLAEKITSTDLAEAVIAGNWTILIRVFEYNGQANDDQVSLALYTTPGLGAPPQWDGTDPWAVGGDSLIAGGTVLDDALVLIEDAYVNDNVLVGRFRGTQKLRLTLTNQLVIQLSEAVFQAELQPVGAGFQLRDGVIAGVWPLAEIFPAIGATRTSAGAALICTDLTAYAERVHAPVCSLLDSTASAGADCDGMSFGMSFTADPVAYPLTIVPFAFMSMPCLPENDPTSDDCP